MIQKKYSVYSDDVASQHLFIELGEKHVACWCRKTGENKFSAFEFFQCNSYDASNFDSFINEIKLHSKLLSLDVIETNIFWNVTETLAVPAQFSEEDFVQDNFQLIDGAEKGKLFIKQFDDIAAATTIDSYLITVAQKVFPGANFSGSNNIIRNGQTACYLYFYPNYFSFIVYKDGALQFLQTRHYTQPDDVLYFILNVFHQYNIKKNIDVIAGGLVEEDSKLFQTLYQYIENLKLGLVDENLFASIQFKEYPSHYFLPYVNYLS